MIKDATIVRPRYGEVDQMGYVYHGNYVDYCHSARTELMRKMGIHDQELESRGVMMPVIDFNIKYLKPAHYDEKLTIVTIIEDMPQVRFRFKFEIFNPAKELITKASSTLVFVDKESRLPMILPDFIEDVLSVGFEQVLQ
ncbi:acyl-CoA thioesterase [bacterium]|nr:acyl-CoA thioesterase [bacterium]